MGVEVNNFTCAVNSALVLDRSFEDQIKFAADMLVTEKSVGRGVRRDAVENQFLAAFAGEPRYRKTVAEIAPGKAPARIRRCETQGNPARNVVTRPWFRSP